MVFKFNHMIHIPFAADRKFASDKYGGKFAPSDLDFPLPLLLLGAINVSAHPQMAALSIAGSQKHQIWFSKNCKKQKSDRNFRKLVHI